MTIAEAIKELEKIKDKSMPLYSDCPHCGQANIIFRIQQVVVLAETKTKKD